jgi:hypothetical protein
MIAALRHLIGWTFGVFRSRQDLILENLALRQQLLALHTNRPQRRLSSMHKLFWIALRRFWSGWKKPLILVTPKTVVAWHRAGFQLYWRWLSRETSRRQKPREPGDPRPDLSHGGGESNLGRAEDSWRVAQARLRSLGTDGFTLASTGLKKVPIRSRFG